MAKNYGVSVVGLTVSKEQQALAQERVAGLAVDIKLQDYRLMEGKFDRIVSVGMFEHVGEKNYKTYFNKVTDLLSPDGIFLLHTIGSERVRGATDGYIQKYIFPNGEIPRRLSMAKLGNLRLEDWHNFGADYDTTLMAWLENFEASWPQLNSRYDEKFYRLWKYYLCSCAGWFRSRRGQLWQLVYTHSENTINYRSER